MLGGKRRANRGWTWHACGAGAVSSVRGQHLTQHPPGPAHGYPASSQSIAVGPLVVWCGLTSPVRAQGSNCVL